MWPFGKPKVDKEAIAKKLTALGYAQQDILNAIETLRQTDEYFTIHQVAFQILSADHNSDQKQSNSPQLAPYFYADECPDQHYDLHALPWNLSPENHKALQFGAKYSDIAVHSELLRAPTDSTDTIKIHAENKKFAAKFIAHMLTHQCPRFDMSTLECVQEAEQSQWDYFINSTVSFVETLLYTKDSNDCLQQMIIYQYPPNNGNEDTTDLHGFELEKTINRLAYAERDRAFFELLSQCRVDNGGNALSQLRCLLNQCQGIETHKKQQSAQKLPLFVHHFYPKEVLFATELTQLLNQSLFGLFVPQEVISTIIEFAITISNEMYFDSWYLARNAKKSQHKLVTLWHDLLFDELSYSLTSSNAYNGSIQNTWIPSTYLLKNTDNSLTKIANELKGNNVLHIYRQIIWSILLHVNPLNTRFDHNPNIINTNRQWTSSYSLVVLYRDVLKWPEWHRRELHSNTQGVFFDTMMHVFGGNILHALYGMNRVILVNEYDINAAMLHTNSESFIRRLDARMDEIYPLIIPEMYQTVKSVLDAMKEEEQAPSIWGIFHPGLFNPLLKCYLLELLLFHGLDALVLTFAAYMTLAAGELVECYSSFASKIEDFNVYDASVMQLTRTLYSFNDVKSIAKLYAQYRDELTSKHADKVTLKQNPLMIDVEYRQPPPPDPDL